MGDFPRVSAPASISDRQRGRLPSRPSSLCRSTRTESAPGVPPDGKPTHGVRGRTNRGCQLSAGGKPLLSLSRLVQWVIATSCLAWESLSWLAITSAHYLSHCSQSGLSRLGTLSR